jgi:hypothetical protein
MEVALAATAAECADEANYEFAEWVQVSEVID